MIILLLIIKQKKIMYYAIAHHLLISVRPPFPNPDQHLIQVSPPSLSLGHDGICILGLWCFPIYNHRPCLSQFWLAHIETWFPQPMEHLCQRLIKCPQNKKFVGLILSMTLAFILGNSLSSKKDGVRCWIVTWCIFESAPTSALLHFFSFIKVHSSLVRAWWTNESQAQTPQSTCG